MTNDSDQYDDLIAEIKTAGDVPEPSPLFWNHLSARVRDAVAEEPIARAWWSLYWRPLAAAVGTVGFVVFLLLRTSAPAAPATPAAPVAPAAVDQVADVEVTEMWRMIQVAAPKVEMESVRDTGLMPSQYATDQAIEALTPSEREELVRLLRKEIGASE
jgi:hypothetical protein